MSAEAGWELVVNESLPDLVELVGYGVTPVNGSDALLSLHFQAVNGQAISITSIVEKVQLNEAQSWLLEVTGSHEKSADYILLQPIVVK